MIAGVAAYIDASMVKIADNLALTAGTVQCFVQRKSDSKWLKADTTWDAVEPVGANIPVMTHWKGGLWRLAHTPAAANDVYSVSAVDSPVACYPDNRTEYVRLPTADDAVEGALTLKGVLRIILAAVAGKSSGGGTSTVRYRDAADGKDRIVATVAAGGNRSAVTLDGSD